MRLFTIPTAVVNTPMIQNHVTAGRISVATLNGVTLEHEGKTLLRVDESVPMNTGQRNQLLGISGAQPTERGGVSRASNVENLRAWLRRAGVDNNPAARAIARWATEPEG